MPVLRRLGRNIRWLLIITGVVASSATALSVAQPAAATNENYSCSSCAIINGKENWVTNNQAVDYSRPEVCSGVWRNNGGSYTLIADECTRSAYEVFACSTIGEFKGHGEVEAITGNNHMAGKQDNFKYCG
jgi:hypothetical protein